MSDAEKTFCEGLEETEKGVFSLFVRCRSGEISAVESFELLKKMALAETEGAAV